MLIIVQFVVVYHKQHCLQTKKYVYSIRVIVCLLSYKRMLFGF